MNELSLFTGAGGGILGTRLLGWKVVCAVEIDPYCREVLLRRQEEGHLEPFPIWDDIRTFDGDTWRDKVDVVTAGFPCQPFSVAGKRQGEDDSRNMWPDTIRIIREVQPRYCFLENVPGLLATGYIWTIAQDLSEAGYDCQWGIVSAAETGALHDRARWWLVAYANREWRIQPKGSKPNKRRRARHSSTKAISNPASITSGKLSQRARKAQSGLASNRRWPSEPAVERMAYGVAYGMDRNAALGNGQVPSVVRRAWELLT